MVEQLIAGLQKREAYLLDRCNAIHREKRKSLEEQQQKIRYTGCCCLLYEVETGSSTVLLVDDQKSNKQLV